MRKALELLKANNDFGEWIPASAGMTVREV